MQKLLNPEVQKFIREHEGDDEHKLILKHREIHGVPVVRIVDQIVGRRKTKEKLPTYYQADAILYPPTLNLEQSSSEVTAAYKVEILKNTNVGSDLLVDLTGGFGIDTFFFSRFFKAVVYVEPDLALLEIARHNHQKLGAVNITHVNQTAEEFLSDKKHKVDVFFIDPSRRSKDNQKVFKLADCVPDITALQQTILARGKFLLVKTSPLLDISLGAQELINVAKVVVLAVDNECKELLFLCSDKDEFSIEAINLKKSETEFLSFNISSERNVEVSYAAPQKYLYEPNAAVLKSGAFRTIAERFTLAKLHINTHLYTSDTVLPDFPGRIYEIVSLLKSDIKIIQQHFKDGKANVVVRNYPLKPEELKSKFKLKDGGDQYLLAFSGPKEKYLIHATRLK